MRALALRLRRDPWLALVAAAAVLTAVIYAPTLTRGLVNYDDPWLVADNWILQDASWSTLHTIFFDLSSPRRFVLTPEYLPVRDLSILADFAIWGTWYPGFHLTNLVIYLASIALWFAALVAFGVDRKVAAIALLLWALHPSHAESVAWITERKGLLCVMFAGACALGYAQFRRGRSAGYLVLAVIAAVCAIWSKAPGAFAIAALAGLELALPAGRVSWRRSLLGLAAIGIVAAAAFVPVLMLASAASVVGTDPDAPAGRAAMVVGVHGFYLQTAAMVLRNAVSYPIATHGPSVLDLALGAIGLAALVALAVVPRRGRWAPPPELRAGAVIWLFGWLPVGHLVLPLQMVVVADRYLLFPTLGLMLIVAAGVARIPRTWTRRALLAALTVAAAMRTFDAQASWRDPEALWQRAIASNPADGNAWAMYVEALVGRLGDDPALVDAVLAEGLRHTSSPRLVLRQALLVLPRDRARAVALMESAARGGEALAMSNLALLLLDEGRIDEALAWARQGAAARPNAHAQRALGKVAVRAGQTQEALAAFHHAYALEPTCQNRVNVAVGQLASQQPAAALPHLEACVADPAAGGAARALRAEAMRRLGTATGD